MSMWVCIIVPHAQVIHIGRGFRLLFYLKRACEGLKEREEQVNFTLFLCVYILEGLHHGGATSQSRIIPDLIYTMYISRDFGKSRCKPLSDSVSIVSR